MGDELDKARKEIEFRLKEIIRNASFIEDEMGKVPYDEARKHRSLELSCGLYVVYGARWFSAHILNDKGTLYMVDVRKENS